VRTDSNDKSRAIYPQYRPEYAKPQDGATNRVVRQALYMALDRAAMAQVITEGLSPTADSWIAPSSPLRTSVESAIPQFPFDVAQAQRLLTQVGWVRGADGVLVHQATGERFELDVRNRPGSATERELIVAADFWKALGIAPTVSPGTPALVSDRFWVSTYPGVQISRLDAEDAFNTRRTHTRAISNLENRWSGRNTGAYSNPTADAIQDRLVVSIDPQEKIALHRQLLQEMMGDIALMPLYWDVELVLATRAVKGEVTAVETGWNVFSWDRE
jgi:ABC-type transport system substrate-binding protein